MEKLSLETSNITDKNIKKILEMFPNVGTETEGEDGTLKKAIDFEKLKQELSDVVIDGEESYDFTWVGKKEAMIEANKPIRKTLRPDRAKSVNWDTTENIYIEGDNLEALKLLQESYLGKVKMIYIDPPYNTGKDSIYKDNFTQDKQSYKEELGVTDEEGNKLFQNPESNGRFHSDWCSMIYPRLKLARNLLSDDGVIFISIDDNEVDNLKKICDELFGNENFVATCPRKTRSSATTKSDAELQKLNDYVVIYWKNKQNAKFSLKNVGERSYPYHDERGDFFIVPLQDNGPHGTRTARPNLYYPIYQDTKGNFSRTKKSASDIEFLPSRHKNDDGRWMWSPAKFDTDSKDLYIHNNKVHIKHYYNEQEDQNRYQREKTWFEEFLNTKGTLALNELFTDNEKGVFNNPKPLEMLELFIKLGAYNDSIILDFFSGSASTAQAVMNSNAKDSGTRKFIMIALPEQTYYLNNNKETAREGAEIAFKAGYKTICEIGEERIRRAGKKILEEYVKSHPEFAATRHSEQYQRHSEQSPRHSELVSESTHFSKTLKQVQGGHDDSGWTDTGHSEQSQRHSEQSPRHSELVSESTPIDIGFRVFKVDDTNMKDVYYTPKNYSQNLLDNLESNIKEDRTDEDLLYGVLLDWGVELSLPHKIEVVENKRVHIVNEDDLVACFEDEISEKVVKYIANLKPTRVVFKDSSFKTDDHKINVEEIFKLISPDTTVKVI